MQINKRILIVLIILVVLIGIVLSVDAFQRNRIESMDAAPAGSIPIQLDGRLEGSFVPDDLAQLEQVSFVDDEEGKTQEGWMLWDILTLYLDQNAIPDEAEIIVSSSSKEKSITLTKTVVQDPENMVLFDLSGRGTLKLVSRMKGFNTRDDWIQDVDRIVVNLP